VTALKRWGADPGGGNVIFRNHNIGCAHPLLAPIFALPLKAATLCPSNFWRRFGQIQM